MSSTALYGIIVFMVFAGVIGLMIVLKYVQAKKQGIVGRELFMSILPLFLADLAFTIIFVIWLIPRL